MFKHLLAIFAAVAAVNASIPVYTSGVNYENLGIIKTISGSTGYDTLAGTDSVNLGTFSGVEGGELFLVRDAISGYSQDSVAVQVMVDALDGSGNLLYRTIADSILTVSTVCPGEAIALPAVVGGKIRIKLVSYSGTGGQAILNRIYLAARRVVSVEKAAQ